jgi:hypothetical protein
MAFTTIQLVKKHLIDYRLGTRRIENEPVLMPATGSVDLQYANIQEVSEKVKAKESTSPVSESVIFDSSEEASLEQSEIIPETVVAANNSSMGIIYAENVDYTVNYDDGKIIRILDGTIPENGEIVVWYQYYRLYASGVDYSIDNVKGMISRIADGAIEAGQLVFLDYISQYGNISDESIVNAIVEASDRLLAVIDPIYEESTDQALVTAETYLAMSVICRVKAIEIASQPYQSSSGFSGDFWLKLSATYSTEGMKILESYAKSLPPFSSPKLTGG